MIASCSTDHSINIWDFRSGRLVQHYDAHKEAVNAIDFHPHGNYMISAGNDGLLKVTLYT
jgi:centriolar protein POC1